MLNILNSFLWSLDTRHLTNSECIGISTKNLLMHFVKVILKLRSIEPVREAKLVWSPLVVNGDISPLRALGDAIDNIHTESITTLSS